MVYLWCILDTPLLRERNQEFLGLLLSGEIIYIIEIIMTKYFFGIAYKFGQPIVKGASQKFMKIFKKEYDEQRTSGMSTGSAHSNAAEYANKITKEFPKKKPGRK
jgi:hypothetical protein